MKLFYHKNFAAEDGGEGIHFRKKFEMKNQMFAGLSARRRMKYGYQCVP
jgi:hypothetical protein